MWSFNVELAYVVGRVLVKTALAFCNDRFGDGRPPVLRSMWQHRSAPVPHDGSQHPHTLSFILTYGRISYGRSHANQSAEVGNDADVALLPGH